MPRPSKPAHPPKRKSPPYPFLLEALAPLHPEVRPMFSGFAVYIADKIVAMLRDSPKIPEDNGLWLVLSDTADPNDPALREEFPSLRTIGILGGKIGHWLLVPADGPDFEAESLRVCELLLARDPRLGRIPKSRQASSATLRRKSGPRS
jgi:hypothetical protein